MHLCAAGIKFSRVFYDATIATCGLLIASSVRYSESRWEVTAMSAADRVSGSDVMLATNDDNSRVEFRPL